MSWVTVIWAMNAAACLTLALVYGLIWFRQREAWANLLFTGMAMGTAVLAGYELAMMRAESPAALGSLMRWAHLPIWVIFVALVGFVQLYLRAGRSWLAWTAVGARTLSLLLNFVTGETLNYREITGLQHIPFLGESVPVAAGVANPWMLVGQLSLLLLVVFVADAAVTVWRQGHRRRALVVGGSITIFVLAGTLQAIVVFWGIVSWPITVSFFFLGIVAAMGYELSRDLLRAARLAGQLRESEQQMTLAAEAANLGVWFRDLVRNEIWASERWRALFGFAKSGRLDLESILQRLHPEDRNAARQVLAKATDREGHYELEYRVVLPDGRMRWIVSRGGVEFDGDGKPVRVRDVAIDITQRKEKDLEAQAYRDEVAHLTRVAALSELSSALAHEVNQPLAAILSNAQAAQRFLDADKADLAEIRDILQDIVADDQRASEVIQRLRLLLKKGHFQPQVLSANDLLRDVLKLMNGDLAARVVSVAAELPPIRGDRVQLQQVLINLVLNAGDAMTQTPAGARTLTLRSSRDEGGGIQIAVADSGSGIAPGSQEKIFEPFHTTKPEGLGLGLSLSRSIILAHGGRLWAANQSGGATFYFTLPAWSGETR